MQNKTDIGTDKQSKTKNWKLVNFCEFDKHAAKSYCAIHDVDENLNLGDITKVNETKLEDFNMIVGGSPCQDFSVAGKQKGSVWTCKDCGHKYNPLTVHWSKRGKCPNCDSENIEKTRSSLLVEYLRVIREKKPNFGIYENVKNIVGKQFKDTTFKLFEDELHEYGYNTYWKVMNSKDYGVPQNRERVYLIFIKKDIDNSKFVFPEGFDNGIHLKDVLEDEVDEKYYISDEKIQHFIARLSRQNALLYACGGGHRKPKILQENSRIRKLTPKECFRLMGFDDSAYEAANKVVSNTQLYIQAGNSIVVDVLYYIFVELYKAMPYLFDDLRLSSFFSGIGAFEAALDRLYESINTGIYQSTSKNHSVCRDVIVIGAAMRGRYNSDGKTEQQIEIRNDWLSNAITTVQKDTLIVETDESWLQKKYRKFYEKYGYIPKYFEPYNGKEVVDYSPTITANSNTSFVHIGTVLVVEQSDEQSKKQETSKD